MPTNYTNYYSMDTPIRLDLGKLGKSKFAVARESGHSSSDLKIDIKDAIF